MHITIPTGCPSKGHCNLKLVKLDNYPNRGGFEKTPKHLSETSTSSTQVKVAGSNSECE
jgi:hypothetical protein